MGAPLRLASPTADDTLALVILLELAQSKGGRFLQTKRETSNQFTKLNRPKNPPGWCIGTGQEALQRERMRPSDLSPRHCVSCGAVPAPGTNHEKCRTTDDVEAANGNKAGPTVYHLLKAAVQASRFLLYLLDKTDRMLWMICLVIERFVRREHSASNQRMRALSKGRLGLLAQLVRAHP